MNCTVADSRAWLGETGMPTRPTKSAAEYQERAQKLKLAAAMALFTETRRQLLTTARDYEELATSAALIAQDGTDD